MQQLMFQEDRQFWFETLRNLGLAVYGGRSTHLLAVSPPFCRVDEPLDEPVEPIAHE